ncbi:MAG: ribosome-binding factor A [Flavobacteriales bacterium]|nr:ribosome-binding factor A [Flavobacteriales bacterium]MDW8432196.1 ribosome-binding factor A [Flavobacteriales bacterium]
MDVPDIKPKTVYTATKIRHVRYRPKSASHILKGACRTKGYLCTMDNARVAKYEKLIQRELSLLLPQEIRWQLPGVLITATDVRLSPDLSIARVQLSVVPTNKRDEAVAFCEETKNHIRFSLGQRIRMKIRKIPELYFYPDEFYDKLERINSLLKK